MRAKEILTVENKKDRKAKKYNIKPRNPMGTAPQTGGGAHRDKKKEKKQGYEKHKGQDVTESTENIVVKLDGKEVPGPYNDIDHARNKASKLVSYQKGKIGEVYVDGKLRMRMQLNKPREYFNEDETPSQYFERIRDPEDWDEGNTEPPNNFAVYINGKKWKVFQGRGQYADDKYEMKQYYDLQAWAKRKSDATGKKWEVYRTGEKATEGIEEGWKSKVAGAALAGAAALGGGAAQASEPVGPMAVMATIKMQLPDGTTKTIKKDLGHSYDYRIDDAQKDLENLLDRKGIKKYTIHLDRYNSSDAGSSEPNKTKDYMDKTPLSGKADNNKDYMDKGPYSAKSTKSTYLDKSTGKEFRDMNNY